MPKITRKTGAVARKAFGAYDGEEPTPGNYPAVIRSAIYRDNSNDDRADNINVLCVIEAPDDTPKAAYNGWSGYCSITLFDPNRHGDSARDPLNEREATFYDAVSGKNDADLVTDKARVEGKVSSSRITKINGVDVDGTPVRIQLRMSKPRTYEGKSYDARLEITDIYRGDGAKAATAAAAEPQGDPDADLKADPKPEPRKRAAKKTTPPPADVEPQPEATGEATPEVEVETPAFDIASANLVALRAEVTRRGGDPKGMSKAQVVAWLEDSEKGSDEPAEDVTPQTRGDVEGWSAEAIVAWLVREDHYEAADLEGMNDADELTDMAVEDGFLTEF